MSILTSSKWLYTEINFQSITTGPSCCKNSPMQYARLRSFVKTISISILLAISTVYVMAQSVTSLDSLLRQMVEKAGEAGLAVAVVKKDSLLYASGFGYRNLERRLPVTTATVFPIGSCTKAMTAALIGRLGQKVQLDLPVRSYLPELSFYTAEMNERITVRDLLCHRSGLPRHEYSWFYLVAGSRDSMLRRLAYLEPVARIAEKWQYNNLGYLLLGMLGERVSGLSYETAIHQYLLEPLQMRRSYFSFDSLLLDKEAALGYRSVKNIVKRVAYHPLEVMAPAGGLNSTVLDMARWVSCWIGNNNIIPASFRVQAISSQIPTKAALPVNDQAGTYFSNYGFGWFLTSYRGHYRVEHGGNIDGFTSTTSFFPADSLGIVVLCNREGSLLPALIRNAAADHFLQLPAVSRGSEPKQNQPVEKPIVVKPVSPELIPPTHPLLSYTGIFEHPGYGRINIVLQGDSLFAHLGSFTWWLWPQQFNAFRGVDIVSGEHPDLQQARLLTQFQLHAHGYIESLSIPFEPGLPPIRFMKQTGQQPVPRKPLSLYTGKYLVDGIVAELTVKEDGKMYLLLPGQTPRQLLFMEESVYILAGSKGYAIRFINDKTGVITGFNLQEPGGSFIGQRIQ